jgi:hypothetical protein
MRASDRFVRVIRVEGELRSVRRVLPHHRLPVLCPARIPEIPSPATSRSTSVTGSRSLGWREQEHADGRVPAQGCLVIAKACLGVPQPEFNEPHSPNPLHGTTRHVEARKMRMARITDPAFRRHLARYGITS